MIINTKITKTDLNFLVIFIPLFITSAFRDGLGTDYDSYAYSYKHPELWDSEILFKIIFIQLPNLVSSNEITFFLLSSFVVSFFFLKAIFRHSSYKLLSIIIFITQFYFISYNAIRQFIALAFYFYFADYFISNKKLIGYYILVLFLAQIHFSLYVLVLFPLLASNNYKTGVYWTLWLVSFLFFQVQTLRFINLAILFEWIQILTPISTKFTDVSDASRFFFLLFKSNNLLIIKNIFCIGFLMKVKYFKDNNNIFWFNLFLFGLIINNLLIDFSVFSIRLGYIGDIALIILVPNFISAIKREFHRKLFYLSFLIYFFINFYLRFVINGESDVFNQGGVWEKF